MRSLLEQGDGPQSISLRRSGTNERINDLPRGPGPATARASETREKRNPDLSVRAPGCPLSREMARPALDISEAAPSVKSICSAPYLGMQFHLSDIVERGTPERRRTRS